MQATQILVYVLAIFFAIIGFSKIKVHRTKLILAFPWTRDFKPVTVKFIGFLELLIAIMLVGPFVIEKAYKITAWAALFLALIMVLASIYHSRKKEYKWLLFNIILLVASLVIAFHYKSA